MKRPVKKFFFISVVFFAAVILFYLLLPFFFKPDLVRDKILHRVQEITGNPPRFEQSSVSYFPTLSLEFRDFGLDWNGQKKLQVQAKSLKIYLSLIDFVLGRIKISRLSVREGKIVIPPVSFSGVPVEGFQIDRVKLELKPLEENHPVQFELEGGFANIPKSFTSRGQILFDSLKQQNWDSMALEGEIELKDLNLTSLEKKILGRWPLEVDSGKSSGEIGFYKKKNDPWVEFTGQLGLQNFVYHAQQKEKVLTSAVLQAQLEFALSWNPKTKDLVISRSHAVSSLGEFQMQGSGLIGNGEIREMRVRASGIALESIPQYWIYLKEQIPLNLGFSGKSDMEVSLKGKWDHLSVSANIDLTPAILTYAHFFSKSKDIPLSLNFDCLLQNAESGEILSGDFSVGLQQTNLKGTFADFNLKTREGQINVITNKFPIAGWESLLIPFQNYELQGEMKILANWKGVFDKQENVKTIFNLSLENGNLIRKNGTAIRNVQLSLDYGGLGLMMKQARLEIADSPVIADISIYNFFSHPVAKAKMTSPHLKPLIVLTALEDWTAEWGLSGAEDFFGSLEAPLEELFPKDSGIENFTSEFQYENNKWAIHHLDFDAYDGELKSVGTLDLNTEAPAYQMQVAVDRLNLARFLNRKEGQTAEVEGNLSLKMDLSGKPKDKQKWLDATEGQGTLLVSKGAFKTFDLMGAIGKISELKELKRYASGATAFEDLQLKFNVKNKRILVEKLALISPRVSLEGNGDVGFDGLLNYRLNVFLSPLLTQELLVPKFVDQASVKDKQFGPIPLLLSGPLVKPELQPDPELIPQLLENLIKGKHQKILRDFLPEETFFARRTNS